MYGSSWAWDRLQARAATHAGSFNPGTIETYINQVHLRKEHVHFLLRKRLMRVFPVGLAMTLTPKPQRLPSAILRERKGNSQMQAQKSATQAAACNRVWWSSSLLSFHAFTSFCTFLTNKLPLHSLQVVCAVISTQHCVYLFLGTGNPVQPLNLIVPIPDGQSEPCRGWSP